MAYGCGIWRWGEFDMHDEWHFGRAVSAVKSAPQFPGESAVADALSAAVDRREARERGPQAETGRDGGEQRREKEVVITRLQPELIAPRDTDPGMSLLPAVEYITL
jgi:hypothetical protein